MNLPRKSSAVRVLPNWSVRVKGPPTSAVPDPALSAAPWSLSVSRTTPPTITANTTAAAAKTRRIADRLMRRRCSLGAAGGGAVGLGAVGLGAGLLGRRHTGVAARVHAGAKQIAL